jgi:signal transduction histidine kinase
MWLAHMVGRASTLPFPSASTAESTTRMRPRTASRLAWSVGIFSIALEIGTLVLMFGFRHAALPATVSAYRWDISRVLVEVVVIGLPMIGIVLASKRPENRIGWIFLAAGLMNGLEDFGVSYGIRALVVAPGSLPAGRALAWMGSWITGIPLGLLAFFFLLFPTGNLPSPRWRPAAWFVAGSFALLLATELVFSTRSWKYPFRASSLGASPIAPLLVVVLAVSFVISLAAPAVRFRGSSGDERLQLKWFVTATALVFVVLLGYIPLGSCNSCSPPAVISVLAGLAFLFLWTAISIAVLKYRLYEIDVVISKAVVYGTLAVFITLVYVGLVAGVGTLVGNTRSPLLAAIAAAVIAVAFQPIRQRAGRLANRIVYGKRATPYEVLSDFAEQMAGAYPVEDILPHIARMLVEGTGAIRSDVWLLVGSELRAAGSWPRVEVAPVPLIANGSIDVPGAVAVPVRYQGEVLGALSLQKPPGDPITSTERKLLDDVASQAGLVLRNARLIGELRASRQRIVSAQDAAARRLERNIHDGAQQQLVALAVKTRLADSLVGRDEAKAHDVLSQIQTEAQEALENLRDLARGIYPPILADQGLAVALDAQAKRSPVPVALEAVGISRYRSETEAAVYFSVLEALQNVAKYSGASQAMVSLYGDDGHLTFEVTDDGVGFDPSTTAYGTGLQGVADRLAAIDGTLKVRSQPGVGTTIVGIVPVSGQP